MPTSRIHNVSDLIKTKNYDLAWAHYRKTKSPISEFVHGEYLIHGKLDNEKGIWKAVNIDQLIEAGLWQVFPALRDKEKQSLLLQRVHQLRFAYFNEDRLWQLTPEVMVKIKSLATCFGETLEGVMTIAFVSVRKRDLSAEPISNISTELGSVKLPKLEWDMGLRMIHLAWQGVHEAKQLMQLLRLLHDREVDYENVDLAADDDSETESETESEDEAESKFDTTVTLQEDFESTEAPLLLGNAKPDDASCANDPRTTDECHASATW